MNHSKILTRGIEKDDRITKPHKAPQLCLLSITKDTTNFPWLIFAIWMPITCSVPLADKQNHGKKETNGTEKEKWPEQKKFRGGKIYCQQSPYSMIDVEIRQPRSISPTNTSIKKVKSFYWYTWNWNRKATYSPWIEARDVLSTQVILQYNNLSKLILSHRENTEKIEDSEIHANSHKRLRKSSNIQREIYNCIRS